MGRGDTGRPCGRRKLGVPVVVAVPVAALALGACSGSTEEQAAAATALHFAATASQDPQAACTDLAPGTLAEVERTARATCSDALQEVGLPASATVVRTVLAGHSAMVQLDGQTQFLARFDSGWKVVAAGCTRDSDDDAQPYNCPVKGT